MLHRPLIGFFWLSECKNQGKIKFTPSHAALQLDLEIIPEYPYIFSITAKYFPDGEKKVRKIMGDAEPAGPFPLEMEGARTTLPFFLFEIRRNLHVLVLNHVPAPWAQNDTFE